MAQLRQLVVEGLDGGFLLAQQLLDQLIALRVAGLLFGEEFIDGIVGFSGFLGCGFLGHGVYHATTAAGSAGSNVSFGKLRLEKSIIDRQSERRDQDALDDEADDEGQYRNEKGTRHRAENGVKILG